MTPEKIDIAVKFVFIFLTIIGVEIAIILAKVTEILNWLKNKKEGL